MTRRVSPSIRRRLLVSLLSATLGVWLITTFFSYRDARQELDELLDAHLVQSAGLLAAQLGHEPEELDIEHVPAAHRYSRRVAFQVWEHGTELMLHSSGAPTTRLSETLDGFSDSHHASQSWRVFSMWDPRRQWLIQVGEDRKAREDLGETIAEHMLAPLLVALPLLGLLIWISVSSGLRSLRTIGRHVAARGAEHLAPLDMRSTPAEVVPLVENLNHLFARLQRSLEGERRFTADAAHELRTPLAAIRAQAQVARSAVSDAERLRALDNVLAGCDRAAHLADQLLVLARLEPEQPRDYAPHDLRGIARETIAALAPGAHAKNIDLRLEDGASCMVRCEPAFVAILMRNLIDNAIRYSPLDGTVQVTIEPVAGGIALAVCDEGPGLPKDEREKVWDRFYRVLGTGEGGSGLGLSIVRRIAQLHGATTSLASGHDGRGLCVTVVFPA